MILFIGLIAFCYISSIAFGAFVCYSEKSYRPFLPAILVTLIPSLGTVFSLYIVNIFTS